MKESQFQSKVEKYLKSIDAWYVKYWGGGTFTKVGIPDLLCCINGKFVALELKTDKGKPSELQLHHIKKINDANGYARILRPSQFEDFKKEVELL